MKQLTGQALDFVLLCYCADVDLGWSHVYKFKATTLLRLLWRLVR